MWVLMKTENQQIVALLQVLQKLYSRFLFQLFLASSILYVVVYTLVITYELSEFPFTAPAGYCYSIINIKLNQHWFIVQDLSNLKLIS